LEGTGGTMNFKDRLRVSRARIERRKRFIPFVDQSKTVDGSTGLPSEAITVPARQTSTSRPDCCLTNTEQVIEVEGGEACWGWLLEGDKGAGLFQQMRHHVVWRASDGGLWEVTPFKIGEVGDYVACEVRDSMFIPDAAAVPVGEKPHRVIRPSKYRAVNDHFLVRQAIDLMCRSEHATAWSDHCYAMNKAEQLLNRYLRRVRRYRFIRLAKDPDAESFEHRAKVLVAAGLIATSQETILLGEHL
jgi:hypothetical protein